MPAACGRPATRRCRRTGRRRRVRPTLARSDRPTRWTTAGPSGGSSACRRRSLRPDRATVRASGHRPPRRCRGAWRSRRASCRAHRPRRPRRTGRWPLPRCSQHSFHTGHRFPSPQRPASRQSHTLRRSGNCSWTTPGQAHHPSESRISRRGRRGVHGCGGSSAWDRRPRGRSRRGCRSRRRRATTAAAYQSDENPSASACTAWSTRASIVDAQLVKPIRIASDGNGDSSGAERLDSIANAHRGSGRTDEGVA